MASSTATRRSVQPKSRPLTVSLTIAINAQAYDVSPVANAPGGSRSFRLVKIAGDEAVYDLDAHADRVECTCPSYRKTHEGTSSFCKGLEKRKPPCILRFPHQEPQGIRKCGLPPR